MYEMLQCHLVVQCYQSLMWVDNGFNEKHFGCLVKHYINPIHHHHYYDYYQRVIAVRLRATSRSLCMVFIVAHDSLQSSSRLFQHEHFCSVLIEIQGQKKKINKFLGISAFCCLVIWLSIIPISIIEQRITWGKSSWAALFPSLLKHNDPRDF